MKGTFTISLDFELHWGGTDKWSLADYNNYFLNTRKTIPLILQLFSQYQVHATWACVGLLMHQDKKSLLANLPVIRPEYNNMNLSTYQYLANTGIGDSEGDDPFHYALSLVRQIINTPYQELGSHTFSHYYCNVPGQRVDQFREDLRVARKVGLQEGCRLTSLVFPRNQFSGDYLRVCSDEGFMAVRSNPKDWFWNIESTEHESFWKRFNRGLDAYLPTGKKSTYKLEHLPVEKGMPVCLPASRFLRPFRAGSRWLEKSRIARVQKEMIQAARDSEVYHLWWHPHNFGNFPEENLKGLEQILITFRECQAKYGMGSMTMGESAEFLMTQQGYAKTA